jgi:Tfp pilus assembly pilus retraction ATPase PilT
MVRENKIVQINTILETNAKLGMVSLRQDLRRLLKEKRIEKEIAETYAMGEIEE